jgi:hypothetical protein
MLERLPARLRAWPDTRCFDPALAALLAAVVIVALLARAGPIGYLARTRKQGLALYLLAWAVIFPLQTVIVLSDADPSGNDWQYWPVNAVILAGAIGLNRLGYMLGRRRQAFSGKLLKKR